MPLLPCKMHWGTRVVLEHVGPTRGEAYTLWCVCMYVILVCGMCEFVSASSSVQDALGHTCGPWACGANKG